MVAAPLGVVSTPYLESRETADVSGERSGNTPDTCLDQDMGWPDACSFKLCTAFLSKNRIAFHDQGGAVDVSLPGAVGQQQPAVFQRR